MEAPTKAAGERVEKPFIAITWQKGLPDVAGVNGCRVDDVLALAADKIKVYQSGALACEENAEALRAIESALGVLEDRRRYRTEQGVLNTMKAHETIRTEDTDEDFSATGA